MTNTLTNLASGVITSAGTAVLGTTGNETVNNFGTITGSVDLGTGTNTFNNMAGGVFNSGATVVLGGGNNLNNAGELSPGGEGTVLTTVLSSNFVQTASGNTTVDINAVGNTADQVTATNITVAGTFTARLTSVSPLTNQTVTVATSTNVITDNGVSLIAPAAVQASLAVNPNTIQITYSVNFLGASGLTPNQIAVAKSLNTILSSGPPALFQKLLTAVANLPTGAYGDALNQIGAESFLDLNSTALFSSISNTDNLFSCPVLGGALASIREGKCYWIRPQGRVFRQTRIGSNPGVREVSYGISGGSQFALAKNDNWHFGFSFGVESARLTSLADLYTTKGERLHGGVVIKHRIGATALSLGLSGGVGLFDNERRMSFTGFTATAASSFTQTFLTARARASHLFERGRWYLKPQLDVNVSWVRRGGFTETGAGAANLTVKSESNVTFSANPTLEVGTQFKFLKEITMRPYIRAGLIVFSQNSNSVTASFTGAPGVSFTTNGSFDNVFGTVTAGFTSFLTNSGKEGPVAIRVEYNGRYSANSRQHGVTAKFSVKF